MNECLPNKSRKDGKEESQPDATIKVY